MSTPTIGPTPGQAPDEAKGEQLWLELPAMSASAPARLLVFLHGAGSRPETFAPVAIAWQLKFPGATGIILQGPLPSPAGQGYDWFDSRSTDAGRRADTDEAALAVGARIRELQRVSGIGPDRTVLIGFSQGATVALQAVRQAPDLCAIVVAYAARLSAPIRPGERITASIHLVHGELDSVVPVVHARQALRGLLAAGARVTLDVNADAAHTIGQEGVIVGTTRTMQSIFRGRKPVTPAPGRSLH